MKSHRLLILIHILLLVCLVGYSIWGYLTLPDKYAAHFNARGEVDRWVEKGNLEYWLLPVVPVVVGIGMLVLLKYPHVYNYPQKERVNRWPLERRLPVYDMLKEMLLIVAILIDLVFVYTQIAVVNSATGGLRLSMIGIFGPVLLLPVVLIVYLVKISRLVERIEINLTASGWIPEAKG